MGLIEYIDKLVTEHGSASVLDKHLTFVREQAQAMEKKVAELDQENTTLKKRITQLEGQIAAKSARDEFVESHGALFKRKPTGGYHDAVYCPTCRGPMVSFENCMPYSCRCGTGVNFTGYDVHKIRKELQ